MGCSHKAAFTKTGHLSHVSYSATKKNNCKQRGGVLTNVGSGMREQGGNPEVERLTDVLYSRAGV